MMIIKTKKFDRWARNASLTDELISQAVEEMLDGLIDADLGGGVFKKRVALPGKGKSGDRYGEGRYISVRFYQSERPDTFEQDQN